MWNCLTCTKIDQPTIKKELPENLNPLNICSETHFARTPSLGGCKLTCGGLATLVHSRSISVQVKSTILALPAQSLQKNKQRKEINGAHTE